VIDLTRARYLGLAHPRDALARWDALTSGRPAVLGEHPAIAGLAHRLAALVGLERATLAPSTLHVVTDLFAALPQRVRRVHLDACTYAVSRWGLERAQLRGVEVITFHSPRELERQLRCDGASAIVCDSVCVACRTVKPLRRLQHLAAAARGWLIVDDSQGVGLLGERPSRAQPYGGGGGGTLRFEAAAPERVIAIGSLAKAFGAPLAFLAGDASTVAWFERTSGTRIHASPCNAAALAALHAALAANATCGDSLRARLVDRVAAFRAAVAGAGGELRRGLFPVQTTPPLRPQRANAIAARLERRGVAVLRLRATAGRQCLGFVITADADRTALARAGATVGMTLVVTSRCEEASRGETVIGVIRSPRDRHRRPCGLDRRDHRPDRPAVA